MRNARKACMWHGDNETGVADCLCFELIVAVHSQQVLLVKLQTYSIPPYVEIS